MNNSYNYLINQINNIKAGYSIGSEIKDYDLKLKENINTKIWEKTGNVSFNNMIIDSEQNIYVIYIKFPTYDSNDVNEDNPIFPKYNSIKKIDSNGNEIWNIDNDTSRMTLCLCLDNNENLCVAYSYSFDSDNNNNIFLKKFDKLSGKLIQEYSNESIQYIYAMTIDKMNNIYLNCQNCTKKIDSNGNEIWSIDEQQLSKAMVLDKDMNLYISYFSDIYNASNESSVKILRKIDSNGKEIWNISGDPYIVGIVLDSENNIYVARNDDNHGGGQEYMAIIKLNSIGEKIWVNSSLDFITNLSIDSYDNIYVSYGGNNIAHAQKINSSGKILWDTLVRDSNGTIISGKDVGEKATNVIGVDGNIYVCYENYYNDSITLQKYSLYNTYIIIK